jgi:Uma2 family endonuclease
MSITAPHPAPSYGDYDPLYPDSDGEPMADNTTQFRYIVLITGGLRAMFQERDDVFVAGDLLWYPVEGHPEIRAAPDAMVVFGRPKGERRSYQQWHEAGVAPQVVFEIQSPRNRFTDLMEKWNFYNRYGVIEYYLYDPDQGELSGWIRAVGESGTAEKVGELRPIAEMVGWVSPLLGVRFELGPTRRPDQPKELPWRELWLFGPDGQPFAAPEDLAAQRNRAIEERKRAEALRKRAEAAARRSEEASLRAEAERRQAEAEREKAEAERDAERQARERLAARLRALGVDPDG